MNIKKIGLTALAGSLVATSLVAGEMAVTGSASMKVRHVDTNSAGKAYSMGNQLEFAGSGELDNGLDVKLSFVLDQNDDTYTAAASATAPHKGTPFDSHSVTVSSDALGALTFAGEGGSSAQGAIDTTAAGDLWDSSFGITLAQDPKSSKATDNMISYALPSVVDGVGASVSYTPKGTGHQSSSAYALSYTGVEGLALHYGKGDDNSVVGAHADVTTMKATYAYGPVSVGYSETEFDSENTGADYDQDVESYSVSYTVSENISVGYGIESISQPNDTTANHTDIEVSALTASYTAGGMTLSAMMGEADNIAHTTSAAEDKEMWHLVASFAF